MYKNSFYYHSKPSDVPSPSHFEPNGAAQIYPPFGLVLISFISQANLTPLEFVGGEAGATSMQKVGFGPLNAFARGKEFPWSTKAGHLPAIVWYHFPKAHAIAKFGFSTRRDGNGRQGPTTFEFVGSGDCAQWRRLVLFFFANQFHHNV